MTNPPAEASSTSQVALPVPGSKLKRRRLRGSCDICKQRKIRCDSSQMPGNRCSGCIAYNSECTHTLSTKSTTSKGSGQPTNSLSPTSDAEKKTAKAHVAAIVSQATSYIGDVDVRRVLLDVARYARGLENELDSRNGSSVSSSLNPTSSPSPPALIKEEDPDFFVNGTLAERFDRFRLDSDLPRYFGKSSHFTLINTAMAVQLGTEDPSLPKKKLPPAKRPLFWRSPWEYDHLDPRVVSPTLIFPPPDLLRSLVDLFFARVNVLLVILHRPTFEKSLASGLHLVDHQFGCVVLGVCAVSAKYSDDPRVILEKTNTRLSSGWKYFCQLELIRKSLIRSFTLYEAQTLCLSMFYLQGSSSPDGCWVLSGLGMRYAQEAGIHRRNRYDDKVLNEQWTRVFWVLICVDVLASSLCGRPRAISEEDYDVDYPVECDDEYWETSDPSLAFKQPPGKPSVVSYFIAYLKLMEIMGMAQKTIYLVNRKDRSEKWFQDAVITLDTALNTWTDLIPLHLRWDPHMGDPIFATQSAVLYACYYHVQIQVHRIFLSKPARPPPSPRTCHMEYNYRSLAICASSARACSHIVNSAAQRGFLCHPQVLNAVFDSCLVLLLNVWGGKFVGLAVEPQKYLQDVESCLRIFRIYETRWHLAGRQHDIIVELLNAANVDTLYTPNPLKRGRDDDTETPTSDLTPDSNQPIEGETFDQQIFGSAAAGLTTDPLFALPMYTEDLSRLPIYEPLNWDIDNWGKDLTLPDTIESTVFPSAPFSDPLGSTTALASDAAVPTGFLDVPGGYDWDDWGKYITSVEELMQSLEHPT
ncbi:fungal-specific transcription factor domain-containing protein [Mycena galopus ATCC 62051]|nr:fungal-specific transcription factor domain-containing protein [Mycena galopus ATCC 62051]